jgi:preprotein translocase subunit SecD
MLQFTRIQTTAILVTVLVICGFAVPNFVSDETVRGWPDWAQGRIALAPELQGGTSVLLEVDRNAVRDHVLTSLFREVRSALHDVRINLANPVTVRSGSVEVRPLTGDFEAALAKLRELSRAFNGVRPVEVTDAGGGLIRVTPTEAGVREYEPPIVDRSIGIIRARLFGRPATIEREGANRLKVQVPRLGPAELYNRMN